MSDRALISGVVFRQPAQKMTKAGHPFAFLTIRSGSGDAARWWKVFVFSELSIAEVMQLSDGKSIAVSGEFDAEIYAPAGAEPRVTWKITADAVLSAKRLRPKEPRKVAGAAPATRPSAAPDLLNRGRDFDDEIPF